MEPNFWTVRLKSIYQLALEKYRTGQRGADTFFSPADAEFLASIGLRPIHVYDYAEDADKSEWLDWETFLLVVAARRDYFVHELNGEWTVPSIREVDLPSKDEAYDEIGWLPRIVPKAMAYLHGALPPEIMYGCGGDRKFFAAWQVHPADFLRVSWAAKGDLGKISKFVKAAAGTQPSP